MKNKKITLFLCLCLFACYRSTGQNLAATLCGGDSRVWELRDIDLYGSAEWESEEFGDDPNFEKNSELAQLLPETITFNADGTCEILYVSSYNEDDDSPSDNFSDEDVTVSGTWSVSGNTVTVRESDGDGWWWQLTSITVKEDEDGSNFECKFSYDGPADDIVELIYDWEGE